MESPHDELARRHGADYARNTLFHLPCRFLGKSKGKNPGRIGSATENICNPACQDPCFSGTGTGNDQHRAFCATDRFSLLLVQSIKNSTHFIAHNSAKLRKK